MAEIIGICCFFSEAVCGIALILGYRSQVAAGLLIPILIGATWAHRDAGWLFVNEGGGWEYPLVLVLMAVVQVLLGNGKYAVEKERYDEK
ncbi:DoxX family protein [Agaribacter flavus]|uniref:DoxX family protein n=1 Tax=Agaribacter flavus TaxID=1902781 RepID=A0ABV7FLN6_9ALTE